MNYRCPAYPLRRTIEALYYYIHDYILLLSDIDGII